MKIKTLFKLISAVVSFIVLVMLSSYFLLSPKQSGDKTVNISEKLIGWKIPAAEFSASGRTSIDSRAYSNLRIPGGIPQGLPVRLKIPIIGVDTAIEDALITPDGRMDVPQGSVNVAWFALGPHPGQIGSAVIGGHFGIDSGVSKVFYNLNKLTVGDKIYIEDDKGGALAFVVRRIQLFDRNADAATVFTSEDGLAHLNIITCEGVWNKVNDSYPDRRVVFTDAIPSEGPVAVTDPKIATKSTPTLTSSSVKNSSASPQILIASARSLYATPIVGLITSFLFISIFFVVFKIFRIFRI